MTSSEKPRQFCMKSQLILIPRGLSINNQKLVDLLFQPLTRKHEIRGDAFSKSFSILFQNKMSHLMSKMCILSMQNKGTYQLQYRAG